MKKKYLMLVILMVTLLFGCGTTEVGSGEKELKFKEINITDVEVKTDILSELNKTTRGPQNEIYFAITKQASVTNGDKGNIVYKFKYSESTNTLEYREGIITYYYSWINEDGIYHWERTSFELSNVVVKKNLTIKGKVINGITKNPVSGVRVYAEDKVNGIVSTSVLTDEKGEYTLLNVPAGSYEIQAYIEEFEVGSLKNISITEESTTVSDIVLLPQVDDIDGSWTLISGKVIDGDGLAVSGCKVELSGVENSVTLTDTNGNYFLNVKRAGDYNILVTKRYRECFESKTVAVKITDEILRLKQFKQDIYLVNKAPIATIKEPLTPVTATAGSNLKVVLEVSDPDGRTDLLKYDWKFSQSTIIPVDMSQGNSIEVKLPATVGQYEITVAVYDQKAGVTEKKITVNVISAVPTWNKVENVPFAGRKNHETIVYKDKLWIIAGDEGNSNCEVWNSNNGINWTKINADTNTRYSHSCVVYDNKLWLIGGEAFSGAVRQEIWNTIDGITWNNISFSLPFGGIKDFGFTVFNNKMMVIGGYTNNGPSSSVWETTDGINWTNIKSGAPWGERTQLRVEVFNNKLWVIGGLKDPYVLKPMNDVWSSTDGINWVCETANAPWQGRGDLSSVVYKNKLWIFGGVYSNDVWSSADGVNWTKENLNVSALDYYSNRVGRFGHTTTVFNDKVFMIGGERFDVTLNYQIRSNDIWYFQ